MIIDFSNISKNYRYFEKTPGVLNSIRDLFNRQYKYREAVKNVSFKVENHEIIGLIGPNGAGKTTILKLLTGIISPTEGSIKILGYNPYQRKNDFKKRISFVMGNKMQSFWDLPANDSFLACKIIYNINPDLFKQRVDFLSKLLKIDSKLNVPVRNLSFGERIKVELVMCLLHEPELIFLDEPTIGLDFESQAALRNYIREYFNTNKKCTFIITSHNMKDIEELCDRIIIIKEGTIIYDGIKKDMKNNSKKIIVEFNHEPDQTGAESLTNRGYKKTGNYSWEKNMDYKTFQKDYNDILVNLPINDISFREEDFQNIVSNYLKGEND